MQSSSWSWLFVLVLPSVVVSQCQDVWVPIGDAFGNTDCTPLDSLGGLQAQVYVDATATTAVYRCGQATTLVYDYDAASSTAEWILRSSNGLPVEQPGGPVSADGTTIMTGAGVYAYDGTTAVWNQVGTDIISGAPASNMEHGRQAIAGDGLTVAYLFFPFRAEIYTFASSTWSLVQELQPNLPADTIGNEFFAVAIAMSQDAGTVAISGFKAASFGEEGVVLVYRLVGGSWQQIGSQLEGKRIGDRFGQSLSLSNDGNTLAVGAPANNGPSSNEMIMTIGEVRVFEFQNTEWIQVGEDIEGAGVICTEEPAIFSPSDTFCFDNTGASVAISGDGTRVAIASSDTNGYLRVFGFTDGSWTQLGGDLYFVNQNELFGRDHYVSMSDDGSTIAVGGLGSQVEVFQLQCVEGATPRPTQAPYTPPGPRCRLGPLCILLDLFAGVAALVVFGCLI